jgi:ribosomal protein S18 acetylase RimI-like enzyme
VPLTEAELPAWREHSRAGFADQQVASGAMPRPDAERYAAEQLERLLPHGLATPGQHLWKVLAADEPVGHLWVEVRDDADRVRQGYVYDVELVPQARGRGLGRATMLAAEEAVRELGGTRMRLNVFGHNTVARRLYDGLGYAVSATMMSKRLDGPPASYPGPVVQLVPMTAERYAVFRTVQERSYAENIARSGAFGERQARAKAADDFDRLLPEGLSTPGHELWTGHGEDGHEVGFLWLHLAERADGLHAFGYDFEVREDLRRRGYGRALMVAAERLCRARGVASVGLSVFGFNAGARALYEEQGFTVTAEMRAKSLTG